MQQPLVKSDSWFLLLLACFLLSGFSGLLYQTAWAQEFSFVFGTSNLAIATVLAAYMGGLALGSALASRFVGRVRRPVLTYGLLELGVAASALAVPFAIHGVTWLHVRMLGGLHELPDAGGASSGLFYLAASFVILSIPTTMMGATLPLLARYAVHSDEEIGRRVGALYAMNTVGAILGTIATGFLLLPALGLRHTIFVGVALNAVVFSLAALIARSAAPTQRPQPRAAPQSQAAGAEAALVLGAACAAGVASFTYEVMWTRLFEHVLGGSVYAFATMLASFLTGIAGGGAAAARLSGSRSAAANGFAATQLGAAVFAWLAFAALAPWQAMAADLPVSGLARVGLQAVLAASLLLPSTLCIGASFPFAVRLMALDSRAAGEATARVYAWNTLGAIIGAISAGFWVIPALAFVGTLRATALLNLAVAAAIGLRKRGAPRAVTVVAAATAVALLIWPLQRPWSILENAPLQNQTSGLTRTSRKALLSLHSSREPPFFAVGRSSTVLLLRDPAGKWTLRTNGLPESAIEPPAGLPGDLLTAHWLGALPGLKPGGVRRELIIGLGGGLAAERVPASVERIDVVELEPEVVAANRFLSGRRRIDPLADPRLHVVVNDARGALALTALRYDAIVSQPSHPWTAGASHLYTRDFFRLVRSRLTKDGIFVQWIGLGFVDPPLMKTLVASLLDAFPYVRVYQPDRGAVLLAASPSPMSFRAQVAARAAREPELMAQLGLRVPEDLAATLTLDEEGSRRFAAGAPVSSDDHNLMAIRSPLIAGGSTKQAVFKALARYHAPAADLSGLDIPYLVRRLLELKRPALARRAATGIQVRALQEAARGEIARALSGPGAGKQLFQRAIRLDPAALAPRFRLLEADRARWLAGDPAAGALAAGLDAAARAVLEGWRRQREASGSGVEALDARLAAVPVRHVAYRAARELRIAWRIALHTPAASREALGLIDADPVPTSPDMLAARALAAVTAGRNDLAVDSFFRLAHRLRRNRPQALSSRGARMALAALKGLENAGSAARVRQLLRRLLLRRS